MKTLRPVNGERFSLRSILLFFLFSLLSRLSAQPTSLFISELWAAPEEGPEWVELYYSGEQPIAYSSFALKRNQRSCSSPEKKLLSGGEFLILTGDTTGFREQFGKIRVKLTQTTCWNALPNDGGGIALVNQQDELLDSVTWDPLSKGVTRQRDPATFTLETLGPHLAPHPSLSRPTPGYSPEWIEPKDTVVVVYRPLQRGDPLVLQFQLQEKKRLKWELVQSSGKVIHEKEFKGAATERVSIEISSASWTPLWLYWRVYPTGESGVESLLMRAK